MIRPAPILSTTDTTLVQACAVSVAGMEEQAAGVGNVVAQGFSSPTKERAASCPGLIRRNILAGARIDYPVWPSRNIQAAIPRTYKTTANWCQELAGNGICNALLYLDSDLRLPRLLINLRLLIHRLLSDPRLLYRLRL